MSGHRKPLPPPMTIIVDTREQLPFNFTRLDSGVTVEVGTLKTGDYSVKGFEHLVCVERKSKSDLFGSCGAGRERFQREFERMAAMRFAVLVCEASLHEIMTDPPEQTKMKPQSVIGTILAWEQRYRVHVWLMQNRQYAMRYTYRALKRFYDDRMEELKDAARD